MEYYTLITGASHGIGKALATELAKNGANILLIALPSSEADVLAESLRVSYQVKVDYFCVDLTIKYAHKQVLDWVKENNYLINGLINNAGVGYVDAFEKADLNFIDYLVELNVSTTVRLTRAFVPEMLKCKGQLHILNVASMASFFPIPYKSVYSASKSFVLNFSRALRVELKPKNINVSCLCPGPVKTNAAVLDNIKSVGSKGDFFSVSPTQLAEITIRKLFKKRALIVPTLQCWVLVKFSGLFPARILSKVSGRIFS